MRILSRSSTFMTLALAGVRAWMCALVLGARVSPGRRVDLYTLPENGTARGHSTTLSPLARNKGR